MHTYEMRSNYKIIQLLAYTKLCYDGLGNSLENTCTALIPTGLGTNALNCRFILVIFMLLV